MEEDLVKKGMRVFVSSILTIGILFINTMNTEASQYPDVKKEFPKQKDIKK